MTRHDFYEQQQRLSNNLTEELSRYIIIITYRLDYERKQTFVRKVKLFELHNKSQCLDDLNLMRHKASMERKINLKVILRQHPWYNELINKVVAINGVKREVTYYETILLLRLKAYYNYS
jgi:hypothetical protein